VADRSRECPSRRFPPLPTFQGVFLDFLLDATSAFLAKRFVTETNKRLDMKMADAFAGRVAGLMAPGEKSEKAKTIKEKEN